MARADPQSITISSVTAPLPRTFSEGSESAYVSSDGLWKLSINHNLVKQGRRRHLLRFDHSKVAPDPISAQNASVSLSVYTVFDVPRFGYTNAEVMAVYAGYKALLAASSDAIVTKVIGGES
jgi:hypothetical protein